MLIQPIYNKIVGRPHRWILMSIDSGETFEKVRLAENRFVHWTVKTSAVDRTIQSSEGALGDVVTIRSVSCGFLTTQYKYFYEDGKYGEVVNDPINYITTNPADTTIAITQAEQRIGNYRIGLRRNIVHLGGTLINEMDNLTGATLSSYPFFPPKPSDYTKAERIELTTTDSGYVNYIKGTHPLASTQYALRSEQLTGRRTIIWNATNSNLVTQSNVLTDSTKVDIKDIEAMIDATVTANIKALADGKFLPADGEDITVNVIGQHVVRSNPTQYIIEMYSDATLTTLQSSISLTKATGDIILTAGTQVITMDVSANLSITDGTRSIVMNGSTVNIT